jgi:hypothetical protein
MSNTSIAYAMYLIQSLSVMAIVVIPYSFRGLGDIVQRINEKTLVTCHEEQWTKSF